MRRTHNQAIIKSYTKYKVRKKLAKENQTKVEKREPWGVIGRNEKNKEENLTLSYSPTMACRITQNKSKPFHKPNLGAG